jgi:hypothetical protein
VRKSSALAIFFVFALCGAALALVPRTARHFQVPERRPSESATVEKEKPNAPSFFKVDDFASADLAQPREWWLFGNLRTNFEANFPTQARTYGRNALRLTGGTTEWFVGGLGTYLGIDTRNMNALRLWIYGNGENSGTVVFELYDDDNGNWKVDLDSETQSIPVLDDKFVYTLKVNWTGWRKVILPFRRFVDDNPRIGDDRWNPYQTNGSGGLLEMQIVVYATAESGKIDLKLDAISFYRASHKELEEL